MLDDFILNLTSEMIGIIVTIFFIDKLLKNREEKRWQPSKDLVHGKILELTDDYLFNILRARLLSFISKERKVFYFGEVKIYTHGSYKEAHLSDIYFSFKDESDINDITKEPQREIMPIFSELKSNLQVILQSSAFLLDSELLKIVLDLENDLSIFTNSGADEAKITITEDNINQLAYYTFKIVSLHVYLEGLANKYLSHDEYWQDRKQTMETIKNRKVS